MAITPTEIALGAGGLALVAGVDPLLLLLGGAGYYFFVYKKGGTLPSIFQLPVTTPAPVTGQPVPTGQAVVVVAPAPRPPGTVIGGTPGPIPNTNLPPGASTTPIVPGSANSGTPPVQHIIVTPPAPSAIPLAVAAGVSVLSILDMAKIAQSAMKFAAAFFRGQQEGSVPAGANISAAMDAETRAAWDSYRAGEWHVDPDGIVVINDPAAPVLNAEFAAIADPTVLDVPLLVPSDFMLLNDHADLAGLTGAAPFHVDLAEAFTAETTADTISQMAHEEMRAYIEALPPDRAAAFVSDSASATGYTRADVLQGLNALGLLVGAFSIYQGITAGDALSIVGGVASVTSNFYQLAYGGQLPGLGVLNGLLGIAAGIMSSNWLGVISGTIGVITGVVTLAEAGLLGASMVALVATEAMTTVLSVLSVVTAVLAVVGMMISNDLAMRADQLMAQAREHAQIVADMKVAWPQMVAGHKAALLLRFVPVLPPARHVEALRAIFQAGHLGVGAGSAVAHYMGTSGGTELQIHGAPTAPYAPYTELFYDHCIIATMRTEEALVRLGVQCEPHFYPLGFLSGASVLLWLATGTQATAPVAIDNTAGETIIQQLTPGPYGALALLDPLFPPHIQPAHDVCDDSGAYCTTMPAAPIPGSGFADAYWPGEEEELLLRVIAYYNPNWRATVLGQRMLEIGTYPVPRTAAQVAAMKRQYDYYSAVEASVPDISYAAIPDPWYTPGLVVPPPASWPAPIPA